MENAESVASNPTLKNPSRRDFGRVALVGLAVAGTAGILVGCNTSWVNTAIADLPTILNIATSIAGIVALARTNGTVPADVATTIAGVVDTLKSGLASLQGLVNSFNAAVASAKAGILGDIDAGLTALAQNLNSILATFHVSNTALQATISTGVGLALSVVSAVQLILPTSPAPATGQLAARASERRALQSKLKNQSTLPQHNQISTMYNSVCVINGFDTFQIAA